MLQEKRSLSTQLVQTQQVWQFTVMTDEPKDVRLPFMVTASEAKAIDEWRYKNKIPSRAEAMRLLINRGLVFDDISDAVETITHIGGEFLRGVSVSNKDQLQFSSAIIKLFETKDDSDEETMESIKEMNTALQLKE
ncbi:hypothetical protein CQ062_23155 [Ochrobactrum sp. MYb68]|nr:hypothetical protein CQ062_23155 [Ochrobactrum sp. MYb68]